MKQTYVPVTLDQYLNESKTITLKRGYGERQPVVVGSNAPIRNQILAYVAENQRVAKGDLKRFIAGLNEGSRNPNASAIMWLKRNEQFFVTESKEGQTFFKLSPVGKRLADRFVQLPPTSLTEKKKEGKKDDYDFVDTKKGYPRKGIYDATEDEEECKKCGKKKDACECSESVTESRKAKIEAIIERIKAKRSQDLSEKNQVAPNLGGKLDPNLHKLLGQDQNKDPKELDNIEKELTEEKQLMGKDPLAGVGKTDTKLGGKLEKNLHNQLEPGQDKDEKELTKFPEEKAKKKINEAEEEEKKEDDELSFDDLDLGDEEKKEGEEKPEGEEKEEEKPEETEEDEKVEITEFIITVTNAEQAIKELDELGVPAEKVEDEEEHEEKESPEEEKAEHEEGGSEEGKEEKEEEKPEETGGLDLGEAAEGEEETATEEKIKVSVDYWDKLKGWLEGKGYDIEELFGGEIEVEDETEEKPEGEEGTDDFELDLGDEGEGKEGESSDEFSLDLEEGTEGPIEDAPADTLADKIADKVAQKIVDKL
jgi:hypothetical protein